MSHAKVRQAVAALITAVGVFMTSMALPPVAQAADAWAFSGTVSGAERGSTTVILKGDFTAPTSGWSGGGLVGMVYLCMVKRGDPQPSSPYSAPNCRLQPVSEDWWAPGQTRYGETSFEAPSAGAYDFWVNWYAAAEGSGSMRWQQMTGTPPVTIVLPTTSHPVLVPSATSVIAGSPVTMTAAVATSWSDGTSTNEAVPRRATITLQIRSLGSAAWRSAGSESPSTGTVKDSFEARYLINDEPSPTVLITAIRPTSTMRFTALDANKLTAFRGTPITFRYSAETLYDDNQWRPADRVAVQIQFAPTRHGKWQTVATGRLNEGSGSKSVRAAATGFWRVRTDSAASVPIRVRVKKP